MWVLIFVMRWHLHNGCMLYTTAGQKCAHDKIAKMLTRGHVQASAACAQIE